MAAWAWRDEDLAADAQRPSHQGPSASHPHSPPVGVVDATSNFRKKEIPSPILMRICYNTRVLRDSGEPYRSRTGEDQLPRPPCGRIADLHDSKHDVHRKYWSYFTRSERHGCGLCAPLGRLARFDAFVSGLTRASGECMGEGKSAPSSCIRRGAGRRRERARRPVRELEKSQWEDKACYFSIG